MLIESKKKVAIIHLYDGIIQFLAKKSFVILKEREREWVIRVLGNELVPVTSTYIILSFMLRIAQIFSFAPPFSFD